MNLLCSICKSKDVRPAHAKSFLEANVLAWVGVRPFRCESCRNRFYHFSLQNGQDHSKPGRQRRRRRREEIFPQSLNPSDEQEFQELIARIRRDERKFFGSADHENEPQ